MSVIPSNAAEFRPAGSIYYSGDTEEKLVALTFDDGPHKYRTPEILDILRENNVKATFFVVGAMVHEYPDIVLRALAEGHEIGNHTFSHPDLKKISASDFIDEVRKTSDVIYNITGKTPKLFRPPGGYLNNDIVKEIIECDGKPVLWSWRQDTRDWACPSADCIVETVIGNLKDGDIILFHDYNAGSSPTPVALERILKELSEDGYRFVTVSELMSI